MLRDAIMLVVWLFILVINVAVFVVAAFFVKRALKELAIHSSVSLFATTGQLFFLGAVFSILVLPVIVMWVACLMLAVAFFKIKKPQSVQQ